jgi:hypothetical protein
MSNTCNHRFSTRYLCQLYQWLEQFSCARRHGCGLPETPICGILRYGSVHDGPHPGSGDPRAGRADIPRDVICLSAWRGCGLCHDRGRCRDLVEETRGNLGRTKPFGLRLPDGASCRPNGNFQRLFDQVPAKIALVPCARILRFLLKVTCCVGGAPRAPTRHSSGHIRDPGKQARNRNNARGGWNREYATVESAATHLIQTHGKSYLIAVCKLPFRKIVIVRFCTRRLSFPRSD